MNAGIVISTVFVPADVTKYSVALAGLDGAANDEGTHTPSTIILKLTSKVVI